METRDDEGRLHSFSDQPAQVLPSGQERWYRHGLRHRDDGPAAIYPDGRRLWFVEGVLVRSERA